jgi:hypothetical protein
LKNTLAYYDVVIITPAKRFTAQATNGRVIALSTKYGQMSVGKMSVGKMFFNQKT